MLTFDQCKTVRVPDWTPAGYDLIRQDRCVYAFVTPDDSRVKIGMVASVARLPARLREVARKHEVPALRIAAYVVVPDVTSQEIEHFEAVIRHWLANAAKFQHSGSVDWLDVPADSVHDWQAVMDAALSYALAIDPWPG